MVALFCGGLLHSQQWSVTSAQMFLQQLQTHNPREGFQGDESPAASETNNHNGSGTKSNSDGRLSGTPLQRRTDLNGIHFVPYFITQDMRAMPITLAELHGKPAATLQFESSLQQRELLNVEDLGQQLKDAADVALSTVQGDAGGLLGAALEQAGVPCVGTPSAAARVVANKYRCAVIWQSFCSILCFTLCPGHSRTQEYVTCGSMIDSGLSTPRLATTFQACMVSTCNAM